MGTTHFYGDVSLQGYGSLTYAELNDISINAGDSKSFYITVIGRNENENLLMMYESNSLGSTLVENEDMRILQGKAITHPFGGPDREAYSTYGINGGFQYKLRGGGVGGCVDLDEETFFVDNVVNERNCDWLADNAQRFDYLCKFFNVARKCPVTCDFCDALQEAA